jgi:hypothetical protein
VALAIADRIIANAGAEGAAVDARHHTAALN